MQTFQTSHQIKSNINKKENFRQEGKVTKTGEIRAETKTVRVERRL